MFIALEKAKPNGENAGRCTGSLNLASVKIMTV
jgi:hypothetical protein